MIEEVGGNVQCLKPQDLFLWNWDVLEITHFDLQLSASPITQLHEHNTRLGKCNPHRNTHMRSLHILNY